MDQVDALEEKVRSLEKENGRLHERVQTLRRALDSAEAQLARYEPLPQREPAVPTPAIRLQPETYIRQGCEWPRKTPRNSQQHA